MPEKKTAAKKTAAKAKKTAVKAKKTAAKSAAPKRTVATPAPTPATAPAPAGTAMCPRCGTTTFAPEQRIRAEGSRTVRYTVLVCERGHTFARPRSR